MFQDTALHDTEQRLEAACPDTSEQPMEEMHEWLMAPQSPSTTRRCRRRQILFAEKLGLDLGPNVQYRDYCSSDDSE